MKLVSEITHNINQTAHMLSLVAADRGDVKPVVDSSKEMDTWKEMYEAMKQGCFALQKEFATLQEKAKLADSLQEEVKIHDSPFTLAIWVTELENTLKAKEKRRLDASNVVIEMTQHAKGDYITFQREAKAHVKALKTLEDKVADLNSEGDAP